MLIEVGLIRAVPRDFKKDLEDPLLRARHKEGQLLQDNSYGAALQDGRRVFLHNFFEAFYTGL